MGGLLDSIMPSVISSRSDLSLFRIDDNIFLLAENREFLRLKLVEKKKSNLMHRFHGLAGLAVDCFSLLTFVFFCVSVRILSFYWYVGTTISAYVLTI